MNYSKSNDFFLNKEKKFDKTNQLFNKTGRNIFFKDEVPAQRNMKSFYSNALNNSIRENQLKKKSEKSRIDDELNNNNYSYYNRDNREEFIDERGNTNYSKGYGLNQLLGNYPSKYFPTRSEIFSTSIKDYYKDDILKIPTYEKAKIKDIEKEILMKTMYKSNYQKKDVQIPNENMMNYEKDLADYYNKAETNKLKNQIMLQNSLIQEIEKKKQRELEERKIRELEDREKEEELLRRQEMLKSKYMLGIDKSKQLMFVYLF